jgi:2-phospho-L-lactate guanylyltransferase
VELSLPGLASLRRDVDQPRDLSAASDLGVGPHTAAVAARLG